MATPPFSHPSGKRVPWWLWLNLLSLDAPIVAVLWQTALAHCYSIKLLPGAQVTLFLAVWLIYIVDRVLDSFSPVPDRLISARHAYYRRNRTFYCIVVIPAISLLLGLLSFLALPTAVMLRGASLAFVVAIYLLHFAGWKQRHVFIVGNVLICALGLFVLWYFPLPKKFQLITSSSLLLMLAVALTPRWRGILRMFPKELICGYLFAVGCSLTVNFHTMNLDAGPFSLDVLLMSSLFALNCVAIACYERKSDALVDQNSISQTWPAIVRLYPALLVTFGAFAAYVVTHGVSPELVHLTGAVALSTTLLAALHIFARRLTPDLSRVLVDVAVALPIVLLIMRP